MEKIILQGFTVGHRKIEISEAVFRQAVTDERLDHELDAYLSNMDETTVVVDPDGIAIDPYCEVEPDLLKMIRPILDEIPTWRVEQYVAGRRSDEE